MPPRIDLVGQRFGSWEVLRLASKGTKGTPSYWSCRCHDCGRKWRVAGHNLRAGRTSRCRECARRLCAPPPPKHKVALADRMCRWCGEQLMEGSRLAHECGACNRARNGRRGAWACGKPKRAYVRKPVAQEHLCDRCERWPRPNKECRRCGVAVVQRRLCDACRHRAYRRQKASAP